MNKISPVRKFDAAFKVNNNYLKSLPDVMNATSSVISGANVAIQQVGISNFKLPLKISISPKLHVQVEASITGTVSLDAHKRGINMSRIMRTFYGYKDRKFSLESLAEILQKFKKNLGSQSARLKVSFAFPLTVKGLRSNLLGYQYYEAAFEATINNSGKIRRFMELDFVYSSSCPCSSELAEHARQTRGIYAIPHSQRSKANIKVELAPSKTMPLQTMRNKCLQALKTETQVIVKREDEQAFAELNGSYEKFVEDAARLLYEQFEALPNVKDFKIECFHYESLHSHDAVSAICKGISDGFQAD